MGFRINRGIFKVLDTTSNQYQEKFKINDNGKFVELNADGSEKGATITTDGGTVTGAFHTTHTSNTYTGAHATLDSYYIGDTNIRLHEGGNNALRITSPTGWVQFGSENSSYAHFNTDRDQFYFNKQIEVAGHLKPYTDDTYNLGSSSKRWNNVYADSFRGYGNTIINGDLNVGGTITAQEFHTEFVNQTIIQETGDVQVDGELTFTGAATTSNQSYGIVWSGFDKEGTTDTSDSAYIKHTTGTGGFSGSVLVIHSANDANDGIAFSTNASSHLRHNGGVIWSENNQLYRLTAADVDGVSRTAWSSNYTSGTAANRVVNHSTIYTLGGVNTLQLSTNTDYDETALWFRQYNNNASSPNGAGWQSWKKIASEDWVTSQGYATNALSQSAGDARYLRLTGGRLTGSLEINTTAPVLLLDDSNATNTTDLTAYISFQVNGSENGWVGYGSSGNSDLTLKNNSGWVVLNGSNGSKINTKLLVNGANDNDGKADFAVGGGTQVSWMSNQVQIGGTDMNWGGKAYYSSGFHIGAWDVNLRLFTQGGANNRDIEIAPQRNGTTTEVTRFKGEGYQYFPGLDFAISTVNSDHGVANYFRGSNTHLVIGTGGTLYLNYGQSGGDTRMYGTMWHNDVNIGTPWGSGNDGSGSGLDADTVDGLQASSFIRSDAHDSFSGNLTATTSDWYIFGLGARGASSGQYGIGNRDSDSYRQLTFHVPNQAAYSSSGTIPSFGWYSNGSVQLMKLNSDSGNLWVKGSSEFDGRIYADNGVHVRGDWLRVNGNNGIYFESWGGGWHMTDGTYVRASGGKRIYTENTSRYAIHTAGGVDAVGDMHAARFVDRDDTNYYVNPSTVSRLQKLNLNAGGENLNIDLAAGKGQSDDTLFDVTHILDKKSTIKWADGSINYGMSSSEFVNTDTPFPGGVAIRTNTNRNIYSDYIPVEAGEELYGEIWARHIEGDDNATILYYGVERYDENKRPIAGNSGTTYFVISGGRNIGTNWRKYSGYHTLPTSHTAYNGSSGGAVKYVRVRILLNYSATGPTREYGGMMLKRTRVKHSKWFSQLGVGTSNNKSFDFYNNGTTYLNGATTVDSTLQVNGNATVDGDLTLESTHKIVIGPNQGWNKRLIIGNNGNNSTSDAASIGTTDGNLHIDAATGGYKTLLNYYDGTGGVYFGNGSSATVAVMGPDGDLWKGSSDNNGHKYWHAGNDGSGSGLDADKLDGYDWMQSGKNIRGTEFYADNWFRNYNSGEGMYNENTGQHWYSDSSNNWNMRSAATSAGIHLHTNGSTRRGSLYANNSNHVGLLDAGGSWAIKHRNDEGTQFYTDGETLEFTIGRDLVTGNYGTVQTSTTRSSWGGYSINGQYVFMSDHSNTVGIFNDVDNEWMLQAVRNSDLKLYHNGSEKLQTTSTGVTVTGAANVSGGVTGINSLYDLLPDARATYTFVETLVANTWTDVFAGNSVLTSGTWMVQVTFQDQAEGGTGYNQGYSGTMTWHSPTSTNNGGHDAESEIVLHRSGHAANAQTIYLRTLERVSSSLVLQIKADRGHTSDATFTFKFVKVF